MRDLVPVGVEDVLVAIPHLAAGRALALLDDLRQRHEGSVEILDLGQSSGGVAAVVRRDLASRVAGEDLLLAELGTDAVQALFDRVVELPDRLVVVALGRCTGRCGLFEAEEHLECLRSEGNQ